MTGRYCNILLSFSVILFSCSNYSAVRIGGRLPDNQKNIKKTATLKSERLSKNLNRSDGEEKGYYTTKNKNVRINYKRYLIYSYSFSILSDLNNKGVEYVLKGMYDKAKIIFLETLKEQKDFVPALNNLGVVCEMLGRNEKAFEMYASASLKEPEDKFIRWNFLFYCDNKPDSFYTVHSGN